MHFDFVRNGEFVVLGALCGFLGGCSASAAPTLAIPTLGIVFGMTEQLAQGTALVMAIPNVVIGLVRYAQKAKLDLRAAVLLAGAALPVAYLCALVATSLASRPLRIAFAIFLILIALDIARRALRPGKPAKAPVLPWPCVGIVGAVCGVFSGFFGIGGAIVAVPAMTTLFGYSQLAAQGMSLAFSPRPERSRRSPTLQRATSIGRSPFRLRSAALSPYGTASTSPTGCRSARCGWCSSSS